MMSEVVCRIAGAFEVISECFDELRHGQAASCVGWGDSIRETIEEAIRTYKRCVEKTNEKVSKLSHGDTTTCQKPLI